MRIPLLPAMLFCSLLSLLGVGCDRPRGIGGAGGAIDTVPIPRPGDGGAGGAGGSGGSGGSDGEGGDGGGATVVLRIDSVRPPSGSSSGGETLVIRGKGFLAGPPGAKVNRKNVTFGANPAIDARVIDDGTIYLSAPPGAVGEADVVVETALGEARCEGCYRYLERVHLDAVEPAEGPLRGGSRLKLRGGGLRDGMIVTFGSRAALDVVRLGDGALEVVLPPGDAVGPVDVRVYDADGQAWMRKGFDYVPDLRIDSVNPPGGPLGGGAIELRGEGFGRSARVFLGGLAASTSLHPDGSLTAIAPRAAGPQTVELEVRTDADLASASYTYFDPGHEELALYAVWPTWGSLAGREQVTLVGSGLLGGRLAIRFGDALALPSTAISPHFVRSFTPPAEGPGEVEISARLPVGVDVLPAAFRYVPELAVLDVSPREGGNAGGTLLQVRGTGFSPGAHLFVGALEATEVVVEDPTTLRARSPRGTDGWVPIRVVDPLDPSHAASLADAFRYGGPLTLAAVEPVTGSRAGGARITLRGAGFRPGMQVRFGPNRTPTDVLDPFTVTARLPAGDAGIVDVEVSDADGTSSLLGAFTYLDPTSSMGGSSGGPLNGNLNVTVLNASWWDYGEPVPLAKVQVGSEGESPLVGFTDARGQLTLSSPLLVKPQIVTISAQAFESVTVVNQASENLTVQITPHGGNPPVIEPGPQPEPGLVEGRVWGFKRPPNRPLLQGEREVAYVSYSASSVYGLPPFGIGTSTVEIKEDGGGFRFGFYGGRSLAMYAIYGIYHDASRRFEPLLMGVTRGVDVEVEKTKIADVILDIHMDLEVPITILNPPDLGDRIGSSRLHAYVELGGEGVIPVGETNTTSEFARFTRLPRLSGDGFLFEIRGGLDYGETRPYTATFRRQTGDLEAGVTIGPLLGMPRVVQPLDHFDGVIEWERAAGPAPDIVHLRIEDPGLFGPWLPIWHMVLPGTERRIVLSPSLVDSLRLAYPSGSALRLTLVQGLEPRFGYDAWSYRDMDIRTYTSFTSDQTFIEFAP